jgi:hypothetical protein
MVNANRETVLDELRVRNTHDAHKTAAAGSLLMPRIAN